ncbi:deaminase [Paenibacillus lutimineralis]|uniref:deaminase n=1 Tax=Paenibacillus lutimineralis TaxID=2707005 RepID=UPI003AB6CD97
MGAGIPRVVYGATDPEAGCAGTLMGLLDEPRSNHQVELHTGVLQIECSQLLTQFFRQLREKNK